MLAHSLTRRRGMILLAATIGLFSATSAWAGGADGLNVGGDGIMLRGYDPVAYFSEGEARRGAAEFEARHGGGTYRFASAANRDRFLAEPERYVPAYGGYCALGTAMGRKFDGDPELWRIVDGRLYLNVNAGAQERWLLNPEGFITGADNNWPLIRDVADAQLQASPPAGLTVGAR